MKYFVGIVPPDEIYDKIIQIQRQHGDNRLEPHITLRSPVKPVDVPSWLRVIEQCAASVKPLDVLLHGTGTFGKGVLFVGVESSAGTKNIL